MAAQTKTRLGTGRISWPNSERIVGRYGIIALFRPGEPDKGESGLQFVAWDTEVAALDGSHGSFIATLDGEDITLGTGTFFIEHTYGHKYVGLKPDTPREEDWLDPLALHKVDAHMIRKAVDLYFVED